MNRYAWAPEERVEYDQMLQDVIEQAEGTGRRVDLLERLLNDALQAHRFWARDVERHALRTGLRAQIKQHLDRRKVVRPARDVLVEKPRVVGIQRRTEAGQVYFAQVAYDVMTFDELRAKRGEVLRQLRAYSDTIALIDRLLALADMHPEAKTVQEALDLHEMSLDDYLLELPKAA